MAQQTVTTLDIYGGEYEVPIHHLTWRPAAYAIIVRDDKIVLMREKSGYHMPGGGINLGELPEIAVVREAKEESGLDIANVQLAGTLSTFFTTSHKVNKDEKAHVQSLLLYYTCELVGGNKLSAEGLQEDEKQYGLMPEWVQLDQLDDLIVGSTVDWRPIVKQALNQPI